MIKEIAEELDKMERIALEEIDNSSDQSITGQRKLRVQTASTFLSLLKEKVLDYLFTSQEEEINFFKVVKPKFSSLVIFYSLVERLEIDKPEGGALHLKGYYESELKTIKRFFESNRQIYAYYRSEDDYLDRQLFIRGVAAPRWLCKIRVDQDERFSTAGDYIYARIMATEQIARYLETAITGVDFHPFQGDDIDTTWTGESINLLEMAYGIYQTAQINNGKIGLADLVRKFEKVFNVNIGRPYRRFSEIKQRKRLSRTKYLDEMAKSINKKIDDEDAFRPNSKD
ncbi:RteC domain-containing protein [Pedobacter sp. UYP1]|uniref:RteC domain-containing protein n=1 Tax=Pedobacter sp. UYP1 TaxID=1756396 RepID=UPI003394CF36